MEFLTWKQVRDQGSEVGAALQALLASPSVVFRPNARQWRFLSDCARALLDPRQAPAFGDLAPPQAAQLKFEITDKLRRYYARREKPPRYVFHLVHRRDMASLLTDPDEYPTVSGYAVLVRDGGMDLPIASSRGEPHELKLYFERLVAGALDAEFDAYLALPRVETVGLLRWFDPEGPAFAEIVDRLQQRARVGSIISNPLNPSTKRLCSVRVRSLHAPEATVSTTEYWYLRWWDRRRKEYVYAYRETNRQTYLLREGKGAWKVWQNLRPGPRIVLQNRRVRSGGATRVARTGAKR